MGYESTGDHASRLPSGKIKELMASQVRRRSHFDDIASETDGEGADFLSV
jgi:hypothetical protein